ncbi:hypothetical protein NDU88_006554 [Pleurodeles waltl]|uniref:Uncharacterized protein n=1 Tax=Pleurodeles waltl TaxID=8319 RepID=A0AAV7WF64_PLEWA|nr:hypothetical protein NDU88_006554 [Pleurodeles waltl]
MKRRRGPVRPAGVWHGTLSQPCSEKGGGIYPQASQCKASRERHEGLLAAFLNISGSSNLVHPEVLAQREACAVSSRAHDCGDLESTMLDYSEDSLEEGEVREVSSHTSGIHTGIVRIFGLWGLSVTGDVGEYGRCTGINDDAHGASTVESHYCMETGWYSVYG